MPGNIGKSIRLAMGAPGQPPENVQSAIIINLPKVSFKTYSVSMIIMFVSITKVYKCL